jgi:hypothetical protein
LTEGQAGDGATGALSPLPLRVGRTAETETLRLDAAVPPQINGRSRERRRAAKIHGKLGYYAFKKGRSYAEEIKIIVVIWGEYLTRFEPKSVGKSVAIICISAGFMFVVSLR